MKNVWLNKSGNNSLVMFFAGWSFDEKPFEFLKCDGHDVVVFYDYRELSFDVDFKGYEKYYLVTWSMGVYIASLLRNVLPKFEKAVAFNGTPTPIDDELGIPQRTFDLTLKYASDGLKGKFYQNVFFNAEQLEHYRENPVQRTIEDRVEELNALKKYIVEKSADALNFYNLAYVAEHDKIIPTKNQLRAWEKLGVNVKMLPDGHFPFYNFANWEDLCK